MLCLYKEMGACTPKISKNSFPAFASNLSSQFPIHSCQQLWFFLTDLQLLFSFNSSITSIYTNRNSCHLSLQYLSLSIQSADSTGAFWCSLFLSALPRYVFDLLPSFFSPYQEISKKTNLIFCFLYPLNQPTIF